MIYLMELQNTVFVRILPDELWSLKDPANEKHHRNAKEYKYDIRFIRSLYIGLRTFESDQNYHYYKGIASIERPILSAHPEELFVATLVAYGQHSRCRALDALILSSGTLLSSSQGTEVSRSPQSVRFRIRSHQSQAVLGFQAADACFQSFIRSFESTPYIHVQVPGDTALGLTVPKRKDPTIEGLCKLGQIASTLRYLRSQDRFLATLQDRSYVHASLKKGSIDGEKGYYVNVVIGGHLSANNMVVG